MTASTRRIAPLHRRGMADLKPLTTPVSLEWVALDKLVIDDAYQRELSERSITHIRRIAVNFDWSRIKALSVVARGGGLFEVLDGQHTAIAAATRGDIDALPCAVVRDEARSAEDNAASFIGINEDRLRLTPGQLFKARLEAGDEDSLDAMQGAKAAGCEILFAPPAYSLYKPGQTMAVGSLRKLAAEGGPAYVKRVMLIAKRARLAPVNAMLIRALWDIIWGPGGRVSDDALILALKRRTSRDWMDAARRARADGGNRTPTRAVLAELIRNAAQEVGHGA